MLRVRTTGLPLGSFPGINPKFGTKVVARYEKTEFYKPKDRNITSLG
jgi:hypothetical protein